MEQREETIRAQAIKLTRSEEAHLPWGKTLLSVMKEYSYVWQDHKELLCPLRSNSERHINVTDHSNAAHLTARKDVPQSDGARPVSSSKGETTTVTKKYATEDTTAAGAKICKPHNDSRGCVGIKCPKGQTYGCDASLQCTGVACGSTSHNRLQQDTIRHEVVTAR